MTNEDAIMRLEALRAFSSENSLKTIGEAIDMAISALQSEKNFDKNATEMQLGCKPLTLEQLRKMDDRPVKVKNLEYEERNLSTGVVTMCDPNDSDNGVCVGCSFYCIQNYGKTWVAYSYYSFRIDIKELNCAGCDYLDRDNEPCLHCLRAAGYADYYKPVG